MKRVKFINYTGAYPNLCSGILTLEIDGKVVDFPKYCMHSGGCVGFDNDYNEYVEYGDWSVDIPEEYLEYEEEILQVVNNNVPQGCCGGCI
jgi:hypothetical protein